MASCNRCRRAPTSHRWAIRPNCDDQHQQPATERIHMGMSQAVGLLRSLTCSDADELPEAGGTSCTRQSVRTAAALGACTARTETCEA